LASSREIAGVQQLQNREFGFRAILIFSQNHAAPSLFGTRCSDFFLIVTGRKIASAVMNYVPATHLFSHFGHKSVR
jgi:hypothetical protein